LVALLEPLDWELQAQQAPVLPPEA